MFKEILDYCKTDVEILRKALIAFSKFTLELTGWNPLIHATTFASFSGFLLRMDSLKDNQLAAIPENGYFTGQNQSLIALRYIRWLEKSETRQLQYKLKGGEKDVTIGGQRILVGANTVYIKQCVN